MWKILGFAALCSIATAQNSSLPEIDLGYEIYRAADFNETGRFYNFSNIRYAAPPVGNLRFAAPQAPATDRSTVRDGSDGRICPQAQPAWSALASQFIGSILLGVPFPGANQTYVPPGATPSSPIPARDPRENEDCLFLDVFVPENVLKNADKACNAPVLVWIYGGGYTVGDKYNNPAGLIAASGSPNNGDVIYVAMNYRLGALGFTSGPSFNAEGGVSNLGLYDQRMALEWVQNYIHLFGGDKNRVTVFGESAGGGSIMHQITAYGGAKGKVPFQQAVPQSPGWLPIQSNVREEDTYNKFLLLTNTTSLAELRTLSSEAVIKANAQQIGYDPGWGWYGYGPVVDGLFAPKQPGQLLAEGRFDQSLKVMVGHNANEGTIFTQPAIQSDEALRNSLQQTFFPYSPASTIDTLTDVLYPPVFDGTYPYRDQYSRASLLTSEGIFTCNTNFLSTAYKNQTYSYLFAVPPALHGFDVAYTYYDRGTATPSGGLALNATIAIALQEFIVSFAETGRPAADGIRQFNMYGPDAQVLRLNITGVDEVRDSNANERCAWWQKSLY